MDLLHSSSPQLKDFCRIAQNHCEDIQVARVSVGNFYELLTVEQCICSEQCDNIIQSIFTLKYAFQRFSSLLHMATFLPYAICSLRYPLIRSLCSIDQQANDLVLQLLIFKDIALRASEWTAIQQCNIQDDLDELLQECDNSLVSLNVLLDQAYFLEKRYKSA